MSCVNSEKNCLGAALSRPDQQGRIKLAGASWLLACVERKLRVAKGSGCLKDMSLLCYQERDSQMSCPSGPAPWNRDLKEGCPHSLNRDISHGVSLVQPGSENKQPGMSWPLPESGLKRLSPVGFEAVEGLKALLSALSLCPISRSSPGDQGLCPHTPRGSCLAPG